MNWPGYWAKSDAKIRVAAVLLFRKWFGSEPSFSWGWNGNMGEAWDKRGNRIEVTQHNDDHVVGGGAL